MRHRSPRVVGFVALVAVLAFLAGSLRDSRTASPDASTRIPVRAKDASRTERLRWSTAARTRALQHASVWRPQQAVPGGPDHERAAGASPLECWFEPHRLGGTTPKLECTTAAGETIKVKYVGAEPHGEVAATRLMRALGFAADEVSFVERVRCYGCPTFPFLTMKVLGLVRAHDLYGQSLDYGEYRDLEWAAVERKYPGLEIDTAEGRGWAWHELKQVQAPRAHVDALRLVAVFLAHWDNKSENQRLACLDDDQSAPKGERCREPVLVVQDLGATFGPRKVHLRHWKRTPIWNDRASCQISMDGLPHGGGTFPAVRVSEAGRRFLAERLGALTPARIRAIFEAARFPEHDGERVDAWVSVFEQKVEEISAGPPCPLP